MSIGMVCRLKRNTDLHAVSYEALTCGVSHSLMSVPVLNAALLACACLYNKAMLLAHTLMLGAGSACCES
jgi:hypothetical protein